MSWILPIKLSDVVPALARPGVGRCRPVSAAAGGLAVPEALTAMRWRRRCVEPFDDHLLEGGRQQPLDLA